VKDLTLQELRYLVNWGMSQHVAEGLKDDEKDFFKAVKKAYEARVEMESMDLDDCLGGACKL
jgi:hypothetical protein